ncbi:MAG TPA: hypothetical protein VKP65_14625 [Rhodothermales bacterium]|nr:hypothetical protein [Rhodothermales bacterium]
MNRRHFLHRLSEAATATAFNRLLPTSVAPLSGTDQAIDRQALVMRHAPIIRRVDPFAALSLGNGGFAFTADVTGLQTFPDAYQEIPLATQAEWGWHTFPNPANYQLGDTLTLYDAHGRPVSYADQQTSPAGQWLRQNPHRLSLARIGFDLRRSNGTPATAADLHDIEQRLDLWTGTLVSRFRLEDQLVQVWTWVHPEQDLIAIRVEAPGLNATHRALRISFPYGAPVHTGDPGDWTSPDQHRTNFITRDATGMTLQRTLDADSYSVCARWSEGTTIEQEADHHVRLSPPDANHFEVVISFAPDRQESNLPPVETVRTDCAAHWSHFWNTGGAIDLSESTDVRAAELERRIVLSQYLTAIQCAGTMPPQETGLTFNSWHGKFHLEMHWWHAVHFALWDRLPLLERSLPWYRAILPAARDKARRQGYEGARWPKMVGPDGRKSPSTIGVFLIWQQPHPIYYAELVYRAKQERAVLETYREVVFETAAFMASYPVQDPATGHYVLGPPLIPAQELHPARTTFNPTFELAYWAFGLETAQRWRERLGLAREPVWERVLRNLAPLPIRDGLYVNAESDPNTFTDPAMRHDHPTLLGAYGFVPSKRVDPEVMRRTLFRVLEDWEWETTWGWDYPLTAITAARLGEPERAVDALLMDTPKNRYLPNGHNYQRPGLTIYLPGNGGLLSVVAMMAAGWEGAPATPAPGFPDSGWTVHAERLRPLF